MFADIDAPSPVLLLVRVSRRSAVHSVLEALEVVMIGKRGLWVPTPRLRAEGRCHCTCGSCALKPHTACLMLTT